MQSAKTLRNNRAAWTSATVRPHRATVVVRGQTELVAEPLLLEALANHPGCKKLYFIPITIGNGPGSLNTRATYHDYVTRIHSRYTTWNEAYAPENAISKPMTLLAYDLTTLLKRIPGHVRTEEEIDQLLKAHFDQRVVVPVTTARADIYLNTYGRTYHDAPIARRNRFAFMCNDPYNTDLLDGKLSLPAFNNAVREHTGHDVTPPCASVKSLAELEAFMHEHKYDQVVLKRDTGSCGEGIFRAFHHPETGRLIVEKPASSTRHTEAEYFTPTEAFFVNSMLAMQWLDNSKGDMRVVIVDGHYIGGYWRHHHPDTWLCNNSQNGTITKLDLKRDLTARDRHKLDAIARTLKETGIHRASIDLLADETGERFLSEINLGVTRDLGEISQSWDARNAEFGRLPVADQVAAQLFKRYSEHLRMNTVFQAFGAPAGVGV